VTSHGIQNLKNALLEIQCPNVGDLAFLYWNCVLRQCKNCPKYPIPVEEQRTTKDPSVPTISFHVYLKVVRCSIHGQLGYGVKKCPVCFPSAKGSDYAAREDRENVQTKTSKATRAYNQKKHKKTTTCQHSRNTLTISIT
jgi:hypothetical protein